MLLSPGPGCNPVVDATPLEVLLMPFHTCEREVAGRKSVFVGFDVVSNELLLIAIHPSFVPSLDRSNTRARPGTFTFLPYGQTKRARCQTDHEH